MYRTHVSFSVSQRLLISFYEIISLSVLEFEKHKGNDRNGRTPDTNKTVDRF